MSSHRCCYYLSALSGSLCPPFKIVILDEGDFMTASAQVRGNPYKNNGKSIQLMGNLCN